MAHSNRARRGGRKVQFKTKQNAERYDKISRVMKERWKKKSESEVLIEENHENDHSYSKQIEVHLY